MESPLLEKLSFLESEGLASLTFRDDEKKKLTGLSLDTRRAPAGVLIPNSLHGLEFLERINIYSTLSQLSNISIRDCPRLTQIEIRAHRFWPYTRETYRDAFVGGAEPFIPLAITDCPALERVELRGKLCVNSEIFKNFPQCSFNLSAVHIEGGPVTTPGGEIKLWSCSVETWDFLPNPVVRLGFGVMNLSRLKRFPSCLILEIYDCESPPVHNGTPGGLNHFRWEQGKNQTFDVTSLPPSLETCSLGDLRLLGTFSSTGRLLEFVRCRLPSDFKLTGSWKVLSIECKREDKLSLPIDIFANAKIEELTLVNCDASPEQIKQIPKVNRYTI